MRGLLRSWRRMHRLFGGELLDGVLALGEGAKQLALGARPGGQAPDDLVDVVVLSSGSALDTA